MVSRPLFKDWRKETALVLAIAIAMTVVMTWPLALHFRTHLPGPKGMTDAPFYLWSLWRLQTQFSDWFPNPFSDTSLVHYPFGAAVSFTAVIYFYALLTAPITWILGLIPAYNTIALGTFVSTAIVSYWLGRHLGLKQYAAFYAALLYSFSPWRLWRVAQHLNLIYTDLLALYVLLLLFMLRRKCDWRKTAVLSGVAVASAFYCDLSSVIYVSLLSSLFLLFFFRPWTPAQRERSWRLIVILGTAAAVAALLCSPVLYGIYRLAQQGELWAPAGHEKYSADLLGFFIPTASKFWRPFFSVHSRSDVIMRGSSFLGYSAFLLFLIGSWRHPTGDARLRFMMALFGLFLVLSLGPVLQIFGERVLIALPHSTLREPEMVPIPLPFALLHYIPLLGNLRCPERMHMLLSLSFAVFAGFGFQAIFGAMRLSHSPGTRSRLKILCAVLLITFSMAEYARFPLPIFKPEWEAFNVVRDDPAPALVLEGELQHPSLMEHQVRHGKRMLGGYIGHLSPDRLAYYAAVPFLRTFTNFYEKSPLDQYIDQYLANPYALDHSRTAVEFFGIRYFALRDSEQAKLGLLEGAVPYELVSRQDNLSVYRIDLPAQTKLRPQQITIGSTDANLYLTRGWGQWIRRFEPHPGFAVLWPGSESATLLFRTEEKGPVEMSFDSFLPPACQAVQIEVLINGIEVATGGIPTGRNTVAIYLAAEHIQHDLNQIDFRFRYDEGYQWNENYPPVTPRIMLCSAQEAHVGRLELNGQLAYSNKPGYNFVELNERGTRVLATRCFPICDGADACQALLSYVADIPDRRLIAFMSSQMTCNALPPAVVQALRQLGSASETDGANAPCHIGLGRKGMKPGEALEHSGDQSPTFLVPGRCGFVGFQLRQTPSRGGHD